MLHRRKTTSTVVSLDEEARALIVALESDIAVLTELTAQVAAASREILDRIAHTAETVASNGDAEAAGPHLPTGRVRETPFTRRPISEQYEWILGLLADGEWHTSTEFAKEFATDDRHFRYLKGATGGRMGELYREGKLERGDSNVRGSQFAYRLPR